MIPTQEKLDRLTATDYLNDSLTEEKLKQLNEQRIKEIQQGFR